MASIDIAPQRRIAHQATATGRRALAPLTGIAAVLLIAASFVTGGDSPDEKGSAAKVISYYTDHKTATVVAVVLIALAVPFLIMFGSAVRNAVHEARAEAGVWGDAALAGSIVASVGVLTAAAVTFALIDTVENHAGGVQALNALSADSWLMFVPGFGVLAIATGGAALATGILGRKLGYVLLAIGVLCFVPWASFFAFMSAIIWVPLVSLKLSKTQA